MIKKSIKKIVCVSALVLGSSVSFGAHLPVLDAGVTTEIAFHPSLSDSFTTKVTLCPTLGIFTIEPSKECDGDPVYTPRRNGNTHAFAGPSSFGQNAQDDFTLNYDISYVTLWWSMSLNYNGVHWTSPSANGWKKCSTDQTQYNGFILSIHRDYKDEFYMNISTPDGGHCNNVYFHKG